MSLRRQMLLSVVNLEKYVANIFSNLYYDLIPNIVSGETIKDKGKAKLLEYSGNSVVENQLVNSTDTSFTFNDTHKYLKVIGSVASLYTGVVGTTISVNGGTDEIVDLTQKYPFDTPTSLTDKRIVAYLNEGYHSFNSGTIKDSILGEIGSEPYNLFDEQWEAGGINDTTGQNENDNGVVRSSNYIEVAGGFQYTLESDSSSQGHNHKVFEYDENHNFIQKQNTYYATGNFTLTNKTKYIRLAQWNGAYSTTCFHRTGTRTGYALHTAPQKIQLPAPIPMSGVGIAKNSLEITSSAYVFTRNVSVLKTFASMGFTYDSNDLVFKKQLTDMNSSNTQDFLNTYYKFVNITTISAMNNGEIGKAGQWLYIKDTSTTDPTALQGTIQCQLATPQVISIPKKHLGVVDLGTLTPSILSSGTANERVYLPFSLAKKPADDNTIANIYCSKYMSAKNNDVYLHTQDNIIAIHSSNGGIYIYSSSFIGKTTSEIAQLLSGIYLFYETNTEVQDFTNKMNVEKGGTISGFEFEWVENQQVNNGNFASVSNWTAGSCSYIVSDNIATITPTNIHSTFRQIISDIVGHKYLYVLDIKYANGEQYYINMLNSINQSNTGIGNWERKIGITISTSNSNNQFNIYDYDNNLRSVWYLRNCMLVDLTQAFGIGNEPTSINDWRIQKILAMGYIPTDTTGTLKQVDCEVLPDVEMELQYK